MNAYNQPGVEAGKKAAEGVLAIQRQLLAELRARPHPPRTAESLAEALAARKAIERAKGLLMEKEGLSEQDAFARLRKASQISGRPLKVVAEALIATFE